MVIKILVAWCLVATTVTIHCIGLAIILRVFFKLTHVNRGGILKTAWLLNTLVWWIIALHMIEITIWGVFYWWQECFSSAELALYFAGVTYTTIGYGDLLLPIGWRLLAPVQGLSGILLCGLSASVFFAVVNYLHKIKMEIGTG